LEPRKPTTAFIGTRYVGIIRLGRPLTDPEKRDLSALLHKHDFAGASLVSLRYAFKLRSNKLAARDLQGRAHLRLVRQGWDPGVVTLVRCLCRFVWSEHTHEEEESATRREATEVFLREEGLQQAVPSTEDRIAHLGAEEHEEARARQHVDALRAAFVATGDEINLLWLDHHLAGVADAVEMARLSGRDVDEFYNAAKRRKRHTARLLAALSGANYQESN
jgi:hypothetical protein